MLPPKLSRLVTFLRRIAKHPYSLYVGLAAVVLLPLLKPGFVLTLDMVFVPQMPMPDAITSSYGIRAALHYLSLVMPADFLQKAVLGGILIASGIGMHRLFRQLYAGHFKAAPPLSALFFAGVMYTANPFTYVHFMAGQYLLLIGYALLPFFVSSFINWLHTPSLRQALIVAAVVTAISWSSIHMLGLAILTGLVIATAYVWRERTRLRVLRTHLPYAGLLVGVYLVLNAFWLLALVNNSSHEAQLINTFGAADREAFATAGEQFTQLLNVLVMRGFWADNHNIYILPEDMFGWWRLAMIALAVIAAGGIIYAAIKRIPYAMVLLAVAALSVVLATGTVNSIFGGVNRWMLDFIPFFSGYREPQKFVALVALAYAVFGGYSIAWLVGRLHAYRHVQNNRSPLIGLMCVLALLPLLSAPLMPGGFNGQLRAQDFPAGWYEVKRELHQRSAPENSTVFLPWHLYMPFNFSGSVSANPARAFFGKTIISSSDPEFNGALSVPANNRQTAIDSLIKQSPSGADISRQLARHHIQYVLLAKEFDYADYAVDQWGSLQRIHATETLILYKVNAQ